MDKAVAIFSMCMIVVVGILMRTVTGSIFAALAMMGVYYELAKDN